MARHLVLINEISDTRLQGGNKATLLQNGPTTYAAMHKLIAGAKFSINLETFTFADDAVGREFAAWLIERSQHGVQVNVIYDDVGSFGTPVSFFDRMRRNGIAVVDFNPLTGAVLGEAVENRDHRKLLIVDGKTAITGSVNITEREANDRATRFAGQTLGDDDVPWRDTDIEIEGPAVAQCQKLFVATWVHQTGKFLPPAVYFPQPNNRGTDLVEVIGSTPAVGFSDICYVMLAVLRHANNNIYIANAYFDPDRQFLRELKAAGRRSVDVELLLPHVTDHPIVRYAARGYYGGLLRANVRIYERLGAILHCKVATIDGVWSTVGTSNLDWWSITRDNEFNVVVVGHDFAEQVAAAFGKDRAKSQPITDKVWRGRPLGERVEEFWAELVKPWL